MPEGGAALWAAKPTKKDTAYVVSFFVEGAVKIDIFETGQNRREAAAPSRNPAQRLRFGSEEQHNERAMSFVMK